MASIFISPFADIGSGVKPPDGAKLFFFETDVVTPKDTFTTEAATVAHANPVIADASGVFAQIWIEGSYVAVLKDKNDVQIWQSQPFESSATSAEIDADLAVRAITKSTIAAATADDDLVVGTYVRVAEDTAGDSIDSLYLIVGGAGVDDGINVINSDTAALFHLVLIPDGIAKYTSYTFNTIADMQSGTTIAGRIITPQIGDINSVLGRVSVGDGGDATFTTAALGTPDGFTSLTGTGVQYDLNLTSEINAKAAGVIADGATDDSDALEAVSDFVYDNNLSLVLSGDILIARDIRFRRPVRTTNYVTIRSAYAGADTDTAVNVFFERRFALNNITFDYVNCNISTKDTAEQQLFTRSQINSCQFLTSSLTVGQANQITSSYLIDRCSFSNGTSRSTNAINIVNASSVEIVRCESQDYEKFISITPSYSLAANHITIRDNNAAGYLKGAVYLEGTNTYRISNIVIENNSFAGSARNTLSSTSACIMGLFVCDAVIENNTLSCSNDVIKLQGCLGALVKKNTINSGALGELGVRVTGCIEVTLEDNTYNVAESGQYFAAVTSADLNSIVTENNYTTSGIHIRGGIANVVTRGVKFDGANDCSVTGLTITASEAIDASGLVWGINSADVYCYNNQYMAPSGTPIRNDAGLILTAPPSTLDVRTPAALSVTPPVITASDAALSNAKSYVTVFTLGDVRQLRQLADGVSTKQTMTAWMATVTGETLGWNSAAWNQTTGHTNDMIVDGVALDHFGVEEPGTTVRRNAVCIDRYNRLSSTNFGTVASKSLPLGQAAKLQAQKAWQTAAFRPPLVIDGTEASSQIDGDGLTSNDWNVEISGRQCLGQKANGDYVLLTVDGETDVSGTTLALCAAKLVALGCVQAFNLDGGGSTTLWYSGAVINTPSDVGGERDIPAVMYV